MRRIKLTIDDMKNETTHLRYADSALVIVLKDNVVESKLIGNLTIEQSQNLIEAMEGTAVKLAAELAKQLSEQDLKASKDLISELEKFVSEQKQEQETDFDDFIKNLMRGIKNGKNN